jgi:hypothetical protein
LYNATPAGEVALQAMANLFAISMAMMLVTVLQKFLHLLLLLDV